MAEAKGSTLRATLNFIAADLGNDVLAEVVLRLPPETRSRIEATVPTDHVPFHTLLDVWHAVDEVVGEKDALWIERAGAHSIESLGRQLYPGILGKPSPLEFLTQPVKLFKLYYPTGDMTVVEQEAGRAVLRLIDFDEPDPLFCSRQTGGLRRALELAGGEHAEVGHVRCVNVGDAFCEWEMTWRGTSP